MPDSILIFLIAFFVLLAIVTLVEKFFRISAAFAIFAIAGLFWLYSAYKVPDDFWISERIEITTVKYADGSMCQFINNNDCNDCVANLYLHNGDSFEHGKFYPENFYIEKLHPKTKFRLGIYCFFLDPIKYIRKDSKLENQCKIS